ARASPRATTRRADRRPGAASRTRPLAGRVECVDDGDRLVVADVVEDEHSLAEAVAAGEDGPARADLRPVRPRDRVARARGRKIPPTQPWLQPMHGRTSLARPARVLRISSGSAIDARTSETRSAWPRSSAASASASDVIRPPAITGTSIARVICSAAGSWY